MTGSLGPGRVGRRGRMRDHRPVTTPAPELSSELTELAHAHGIATHYVDWRGQPVDVPAETVHDVLGAMGVDVDRPGRRARPPARRAVAPAAAALRGGPPAGDPDVRGARPARRRGEVVVDLADGGTARPRQVDRLGRAAAGRRRAWSARRRSRCPPACRSATTCSGRAPAARPRRGAAGRDARAGSGCPSRSASGAAGGSRRSSTACAPAAPGASATWPTSPTWRSGRAADLGADYVLVNPLHAAEPVAPMEPSPYLPTSRRFFNPLYLRVERVPEYADLAGADRAPGRGARPPGARRARRRRRHRPRHRLDREAGGAADLVHAVPRSAGRELDYRAFREREGEALQATSPPGACSRERHGNDARTWPRRPAGRRVPRGGRLRRRARRRDRLRDVAAVAARRAARSTRRPRRSAPAWRWARCTTSRSACTRAARTRGGCGRRTPRGSRSARRPTRSTRSARTGASRRGAPTGSRSSATRRSAT